MVGKPMDRVDGRLKGDGRREVRRRVPGRGREARGARAEHRRQRHGYEHRCGGLQGDPRRDRRAYDRHAGRRHPAHQGRDLQRPDDRRRGGGELRGGDPRRRAPHGDVRRATTQVGLPRLDRGRSGGASPHPGRCGGGTVHRGEAGRADLRHADRAPQPDGAARHHRGLGRRQAHGVRRDPGRDLDRADRCGQDGRGEGERSRYGSFRRRRVRV